MSYASTILKDEFRLICMDNLMVTSQDLHGVTYKKH